MSFYVTLPSNSSMDLNPDNTMNEFTVFLKEPIELDSQYEIALVELTYKHSWKLEVGQLFQQSLIGPEYDVFKLTFHHGEKIVSFTSRLNGGLWKFYIKKEYDRRLELGKSSQDIPQSIKIQSHPFISNLRE